MARCEYVNTSGLQCTRKPRDGDRCAMHKHTANNLPCTYIDRCGNYTHGELQVCSRCQKTNWRKHRKERLARQKKPQPPPKEQTMDEYIDEIVGLF